MRHLRRCFVLILATLVASALFPYASSSLHAQDYSLTVNDSLGPVLGTVTLDVGIDSTGGDEITAFQWSMCNDTLIEADSVVRGLSLDSYDFTTESIVFLDDGWSVVGILDTTTSTALPAGVYPECYYVGYELLEVGDSIVEFCTLSSVGPSLTAGGTPVTPELETATVEIVTMPGGGCVAPLVCPDCEVIFTITDTTSVYDPDSGEGTATISVTIEEDSTNLEFPAEFAGFQMGISHDSALIEPLSVTMLGAIAALNDDAGPDFLTACLDLPSEPGVVLGVLFSLLSTETVVFGEGFPAVAIEYETVPEAFIDNDLVVTSDLVFSDDLSCNDVVTIPNVAATCSGLNYVAEVFDGAITWTPESDDEFLRGDVNGDGSVFAIIDALALLEFGFTSGTTPPCMDAADVDGNNAVFAIVDALYLLSFGFTAGPPPPDPGPFECGSDADLGSEILECAVPPCQ